MDAMNKRRRVDTGDANDVHALSDIRIDRLSFGRPFQSHSQYSQIDLADLHNPESSTGILLEMQDRQRYFEARPGAAVSAEQAPRPVRLCRLLLWSRYNHSTIDRGFNPRGATNET
jgi:hypothetical protein